MQITNKLGLPDALVAAVRNDPYTRGDADISCTTLIGPPQIRRLIEAHGNALEEDAAERIWALFGQAVHVILERAQSTAIREERLYAAFGDRTVSGQFDHLALDPHGILSDYKTSSVWSVIYGKIEWEYQLNVLAELAERNGYRVDKLQIVALLRDWQRSKTGVNGNYPEYSVQVVPIPLWSRERRVAYIEERLALHFAEATPACTPEDRWYQGDKFAVMKSGRKTALRVLDTEEEAINWMADTQQGERIEKRIGAYRRCQDYCPVRGVCPQWAKDKAGASD